jgi:hypothetical protein
MNKKEIQRSIEHAEKVQSQLREINKYLVKARNIMKHKLLIKYNPNNKNIKTLNDIINNNALSAHAIGANKIKLLYKLSK